MTSSSQTKTKSSILQINQKVRLSTFTIVLGGLSFVSATAPFWSTLADKNSTESFFGFPNLNVFLYAFGSHFSQFIFSIFILFLLNFIPYDLKIIRRTALLAAGFFCAISLYYLFWVFNVHKDFPEEIYQLAFSIGAIVATYIIYKFGRNLFNSFFEKDKDIRLLTDLVARIYDKHYRKVAQAVLDTEVDSKENNATLKKDIDVLEEDIFETFRKIK